MDDNDRKKEITKICQRFVDMDILRTDGKTFWVCDEKSHIWRRIAKEDILRTVRQCGVAPAEQVPISLLKNVVEEMKADARLYFPEKNLKTGSFIVTNHGIVDLKTLEIHPVEKTDFLTFATDFKFEKGATWDKAPHFCQYVNTSLGINLRGGNTEEPKRKLLCEILTYLISRLYGAKKMIVLLGPSNSGKSVFLNFLRRVVGENGYVSLSLKDVSDRFRGYAIAEAPLVINDEIECFRLKNTDTLKKVISGEPVRIEEKGRMPKNFTPRVKLVFAANSLPNIGGCDVQNAFVERLQVLKFNVPIERKNWQLNLAEMIFEERNSILSAAVQECQKFIENIQFTDVPESNGIIAVYKDENSTVENFLHDEFWCQINNEKKVYTTDLYCHYKQFCDKNCCSAVSRFEFTNQVQQLGFCVKKGRVNNGKSLSCIWGIRIVDDFNMEEEEQNE